MKSEWRYPIDRNFPFFSDVEKNYHASDMLFSKAIPQDPPILRSSNLITISR